MESEPDPGTQPIRAAASDLSLAVSLLSNRQVIVYPTETFYGLLAGAFFPDALEQIQRLKGRRNVPMPCIIGDASELTRLATHITATQRSLMEAFWPGPLTLVFDARPEVPDPITGGRGSVGVRVPGHPGARELARRAGPLAATSANPTGTAAARQPAALPESFHGVATFDGGALAPSRGSTVLDARQTPPRLIRNGDLSLAAMEALLNVAFEKGVS